MNEKAVEENPHWPSNVPDEYKNQEISSKALKKSFCSLLYLPDKYESLEMYEKVVEKKSILADVFLQPIKIQDMCNEAVEKCPDSLIIVP